jgi:hypothetical protein
MEYVVAEEVSCRCSQANLRKLCEVVQLRRTAFWPVGAYCSYTVLLRIRLS